jgi:hypothetical protein
LIFAQLYLFLGSSILLLPRRRTNGLWPGKRRKKKQFRAKMCQPTGKMGERRKEGWSGLGKLAIGLAEHRPRNGKKGETQEPEEEKEEKRREEEGKGSGVDDANGNGGK